MLFQTGFTYAIFYRFRILCHFRLYLHMSIHTGFTKLCHFRLVSHVSFPSCFTYAISDRFHICHFRLVSHLPFQTGLTYVILHWFHICYFRLVSHNYAISDWFNICHFRLVEEFMLLANMAVAHRINREFPDKALLRRHPPPSDKMLDQLVWGLENVFNYLIWLIWNKLSIFEFKISDL